MRGGAPLDWIAPLTPEGTRAPGVRGCYRGGFSHWNLKDLRPGLTARFVNKRNVTKRRYEGYRVATPEDATLAGELPMAGTTGLGGALLETENLVLMVAPTERVAERIRQTQDEAKAAVDGVLARYKEGGSGSESLYTRDPVRRPIRFDEGTIGQLESQ